ncbi:hypothetical protein Tco_0301025 [Tanacetum coccineum]
MNVYKGRMPTKIELTLEQSQQGVSNDVLAESRSILNLSKIIKDDVDIDDDIMDPVDAMHSYPSSHSGFSQKNFVSFVTEITRKDPSLLSWNPCQGDSLNLPDHRYSIYTIKRETGGLDDGVAHHYSEVGIIYHMLILVFKVQSFNVKIVDSNLPHHQRAAKSNKESSVGEIVRLIITYVKQECNKYEHVGQEHKLIKKVKNQDDSSQGMMQYIRSQRTQSHLIKAQVHDTQKQ